MRPGLRWVCWSFLMPALHRRLHVNPKSCSVILWSWSGQEGLAQWKSHNTPHSVSSVQFLTPALLELEFDGFVRYRPKITQVCWEVLIFLRQRTSSKILISAIKIQKMWPSFFVYGNTCRYGLVLVGLINNRKWLSQQFQKENK